MRFTLLLVTHSIEEALVIGSRIVVMTGRPGRIKAEFAGGVRPVEPEFPGLFRRMRQLLSGDEAAA